VAGIGAAFGEVVALRVAPREHFLKHGSGEVIFECNYPHDQSSSR
jgi:hypothetical protein